MDMLLVFLSTAVGTIVGVVAAILMMNRRNKAPAVGDAALQTALTPAEQEATESGSEASQVAEQAAQGIGELEAVVRAAAGRVEGLDAIVAEGEARNVKLRAELETAAATAQRVVELEAA